MPRNTNQYQKNRTKSPRNRTRTSKAAWVPDGLATCCYACKKTFNAFLRRHHCRACGNVFCSSDSSHKTPLHRLGIIEPVRVCDRCFESLVLSNTPVKTSTGKRHAVEQATTNLQQEISGDRITSSVAKTAHEVSHGNHRDRSWSRSSNSSSGSGMLYDSFSNNKSKKLSWKRCGSAPVAPGEEVILRANNVMSNGTNGFLVLTNFRLMWKSEDPHLQIPPIVTLTENFDIPMLAIASVNCQLIEQKDMGRISIYGKDIRMIELVFPNMVKNQVFKSYSLCLEILQLYAFPAPEVPFSRRFFATLAGRPVCSTVDRIHDDPSGWDVYSPSVEYTRMGALGQYASHWRISAANTLENKFALCSTYPEYIVVPRSITDRDLFEVATFRVRGRIPALSWVNKHTGASVSRCSSPMVGIARRRNTADEALIGLIAMSSPKRHVMILDARPRVNAVASQVTTGAGYEVQEFYCASSKTGFSAVRASVHGTDGSNVTDEDGADMVQLPDGGKVHVSNLEMDAANDLSKKPNSALAISASSVPLDSPDKIVDNRLAVDPSSKSLSQWMMFGGPPESADLELESEARDPDVHIQASWDNGENSSLFSGSLEPRKEDTNTVDRGDQYGATVDFLNLANIHTVRRSMRKLSEVALSREIRDADWLSHLEATQWMTLCSIIIAGSNKVVQSIIDQRSVVLHCADGWDRTPQIVSLAMLCLDGYYRSIEGFQVLIEKEWLAFGHQFRSRNGTGTPADSRKSKTSPLQRTSSELSPIFVQWMDCVYQVMCQFPCAFEFSEELLVTILDHMHAGLFGTFLVDCEREREVHGLRQRTTSVWSEINATKSAFLNPFFFESSGSSLRESIDDVPREGLCPCQGFVQNAHKGLPMHFLLSCCSLHSRGDAPEVVATDAKAACRWSEQVLVPNCSAKVLTLWKGYFLRYDPTFQSALRPRRVVEVKHQQLIHRLNSAESEQVATDKAHCGAQKRCDCKPTCTHALPLLNDSITQQPGFSATSQSTELFMVRAYNKYLLQCIALKTSSALSEAEFSQVFGTVSELIARTADREKYNLDLGPKGAPLPLLDSHQREAANADGAPARARVGSNSQMPTTESEPQSKVGNSVRVLEKQRCEYHPLSSQSMHGESNSEGLHPPRMNRQTSSQNQDRTIAEHGLDDPVVPYWQPDDASSHCPICTRAFGNFKRKHHCRKCGIIICGSCSPHRLSLPQLGYHVPVRVCDTCHRLM